MTVCGIDASTKKTGMSLFDKNLSDYVLIDEHIIGDSNTRINKMMESIYYQLNKWNPDVVYIEDSWSKVNVETSKMLTNLIGGVRMWCIIHKKKFTSILPTAWRRITGIQGDSKVKRNEYKKRSIEYVSNHYNIDVGDDVADAIMIGIAGCISEMNID